MWKVSVGLTIIFFKVTGLVAKNHEDALPPSWTMREGGMCLHEDNQESKNTPITRRFNLIGEPP